MHETPDRHILEDYFRAWQARQTGHIAAPFLSPTPFLGPDFASGRCIDPLRTESGSEIPLQTWPTAFWPDGSVKWTSHAIVSSATPEESYRVIAVDSSGVKLPFPDELIAEEDSNFISVSTGSLKITFAKTGNEIIKEVINAKGITVGVKGKLVLLSQDRVYDPDKPDSFVKHHNFQGSVSSVVIEQVGSIRAIITVRGVHVEVPQESEPTIKAHEPWIPFTLRFYLYAGSSHIRILHTITYDGGENDFVRGIGIRLKVPLQEEAAFDRHVRFSEASGGVLAEASQGLTGLWKDPGRQARSAQVHGKPLPSPDSWNPELPQDSLRWVPVWNDFSLHQLSPDGFTLEKRLKEGHPWIKTASGTKAGGVVYVGGANRGGLAIGLRHFWERYPTGVDVRGLGDSQKDTEVTLWLYDPKAGPMDLRPYHDGLGQQGFDDQLDALKITYEDWEPELGSPYGVARTNELMMSVIGSTPDGNEFSSLIDLVRDPPKLLPSPEAIHLSQALGTYWSPLSNKSANGLSATDERLEFLFQFYEKQVQQRRWYGFWDHGDIMHTYDEDRHTWRYDVGGYAWDNSELSPDLWLWLYFLRTGRADVFHMAEALTRHTGEVDVYHLGCYKGLGTRHGVQHWSDSCKQARISNALYRRFFYYLFGGDERVGELLEETLDTDQKFLVLDPYRKVRKDRETYSPDAHAVEISLGTDWASLAASWLVEFERRGPRWTEARCKLFRSMEGIGALTNGFVTGNATYNPSTGAISPPATDPDNQGVVKVSHLSAMFGLFEVAADILQQFSEKANATGFRHAWLEYCIFFNASLEEQEARYGKPGWGRLQLRQGHSRLTAYAAKELNRTDLAKRALEEFENGDGFRDYGPNAVWKSTPVSKNHVLEPADEAIGVSTNVTALYGLAAIQNLALLLDEAKTRT
ncbi:secreted protein [Colletotrichum scovillei]|uniref:Secreted protein n=1 Tax=Colletotrichum scovillei TaxID=1209932 RepID=A0A9P7RDX6_9PEZI|nr:secreted protein [Colletotrichum scovillei]KAG7072165.1 secreted protein [Colletotrichum scovillei]KAG7080406.1 secreted protein [Colletotrichum scovillei]